MPAVPSPRAADASPPLIEVNGLVCHYPVRGGLLRRQVGAIQAVSDVSFSVRRGEALGIVGESGCGKSSLLNALLRLVPATGGSFLYEGSDVLQMDARALRRWRQDVQLVFQNPFASLDPRMTVHKIVEEPLRIAGLSPRASERHERVLAMLEKVGLDPQHGDRYPHQLSGGQRQRVGIARSLILEPKVLFLDEPVSALDVSVQAQVLNLLGELRRDLGLTFVFIGHDLSVVRYVSDRIAVMYLGRIVEMGPRDAIFAQPRHPYTMALISAIPQARGREASRQRQRITLQGDPPNPADPPSGCHFRTRCWKATDLCARVSPELTADGAAGAHLAACHHPEPASPDAGIGLPPGRSPAAPELREHQ
ncbi:ABC transporter ATP-binding protein [Bosea sp. BIWAKO-01]|uniref:ABC transporter ATP-binding protein n=1 Tax=Bosea sp. BIWAKO-01 TaxID=506668 RepID=UPI000853E6B8|nr:oligopeptide/dipeptide ABC transporter ATP-binding protein [Bosea sp. BIWAKO-01]GAU85791.1 oligopeptide transport ATP-binding protein OppF [Bosea sp. BIWAKO-01]